MMTTNEKKYEIEGGSGDGLKGALGYAQNVDEPITLRPTPAAVFATLRAAELVIWHYGHGRPDVAQELDDALEKLAEAIDYDDDAATARHFPALASEAAK
jgi:hypothetical protein